MRHSAPSASRLRKQRRASAALLDTSVRDEARIRDEARAPATPRRAAAPGRQRWQQLPYLIVICCLALALVWMRRSGQNVRGGTLAVAGLLFAAALARLALPERRAGMLASRRRLIDVAVLTALGTGLLVAGLLLPAQP
jgi:Protein of unknown function (DUF3017)